MKTYTSPDGITWNVIVQSPGSSNAMVVFRHPDGQSSRLDRYNWYISNGPESRSVTSRLSPEKVLEHLNATEIATLFRRSIAVSRPDPLLAGKGPTRNRA
jgi:hypothetical protein